MLRMVPLPRSVSLRGGGRTVVIARSQRVRPEVAGPMTSSATKQSKTSPHSWIASLALAMTTRKILPATHPRPSFANHEAKERSDGQSGASRSKLFRRPGCERSSFRLASGSHDPEKWCPVFGSRSCAKKGGRTPTDACFHPPHLLDAARAQRSTPPVGVPPRLSPGGFRPFRSASGQASWDAAGRSIL
jgi:hypothetical protein